MEWSKLDVMPFHRFPYFWGMLGWCDLLIARKKYKII